jgi:hypothetical protein
MCKGETHDNQGEIGGMEKHIMSFRFRLYDWLSDTKSQGRL